MIYRRMSCLSLLKSISCVTMSVRRKFCRRFFRIMGAGNSGDGTFTESIGCCQRLKRRSVFSFDSDFPFLRGGQSGRPSHLLSLLDGSDPALGCSGSDQVAFDVSKASKDSKHQPSGAGAGAGVSPRFSY